jgi:replication factor A1
MNISELKAGVKNVALEAEVAGLEEAPIVSKGGKKLRVARAILRDDTGTISLVLWGEDIGRVREGSLIKVENAFVTTFKGEPQLTLGKYGKLNVIE